MTTRGAVADGRTLDVLEFARVRERVAANTSTERGRAYASHLQPLDDFSVIRVEQARTSAMRALLSDGIHVGRAVETKPLTDAARAGRVMATGELRALGDAIASAGAAHRAVRESEPLRDVIAGYVSLERLRGAISEAIDERDAVLDGASPALASIRRNVRRAQDESRERVTGIARLRRYASIIQESVVTIREGRFVVPVKAEFVAGFPGIVHDASASGQTLFVEPLAAVESNNRVRTLRIEEEREVERILRVLSSEAGANADAIEADVEMLAVLDLLLAKATLGAGMDGIEPELDERAMLAIDNGRHPLLGERAVAQTIALDENLRCIVVSGPNMGGKTVTLKMVGLCVAMAYAGLQVPASAGTRIGRFEEIVAAIGDDQSIAENASTFSAHLDRMREILEGAGDRTLYLVDEIGGGTEPSAGAALAIAMLERLIAVGARGIVTTHATELKLFAHGREYARNASVRFDPQTFTPTYDLDVGSPGQSLAFALARARGVDAQTLAAAERHLAAEEREYEKALEELAVRETELRRERESLAQERHAQASARARLEKREETLRAEHEQFALRAQERLSRALREFVAELARSAPAPSKRVRPTAAQSAALQKTLDEMHRELGLREGAAYGGSLKLGAPGEPARAGDSHSSQSGARIEATSGARVELDVRGHRYVDAEPIVDRWLDDAMLAGSSPLRLIHGKGTGALGRGLQEFLRTHPAVARVRYGTEEEGSHGVTIIDLKD
ncbi:MAG: endonuclease MutS2 [Candidatus Tyrphobacter sp.]